jgi:hypothetical protein
MKLIPTFCDGNFHGFETLKEISRLKSEAHELAMCKQETDKADHMIYGYFDYDNNGNIVTARLYSGIAKTEKEFEKIALIEKAHIYAIHNHK